MMLKYSEINILDIAEIYTFSKEVLEEIWSENEMEKGLNNRIYHCYKLYDKEIAGVIHITIIEKECFINFFAVKKDRQREGIGSTLLNFTINRAKGYGVNKFVLEVRKDNVAAIKTYEKSGFKEVGVRKNFYNNKSPINKDKSHDAKVYSLEVK